MLRTVRGMVLALLLAPWGGLLAAEGPPLIFGLFPNLSPRTLVTIYQPMRDFLESELGQPVELVTAANFTAFTQRMLAKEYDLIVAAPHLARLAQTDAGYALLAHYRQPLQAYLVVSDQSDIKELKALSGKRVAMPDKLAIVTALGADMLAKSGLQAADYRLIEAKSHNNAALSVVNGQADAAAIGSVPYAQLAKEVRRHLRVVARSQPIPSQYFAASDRLPGQQRERIAQALFKFAGTAGGKKFLNEFAMLGIDEARPDELKGMDAHARQVKQWAMETPSN